MYRFRREDTGEIVEVDFEAMMTQDVAGFIKLPDGVAARRVSEGDPLPKSSTPILIGGGKEIVSDALGFCEHQFEEFEEHRVKAGHVGVRFERDPDVPEFFRVRCSSRSAWDAYVEARGMFDKNRHSGTALTPEGLEKAGKALSREMEQRIAARTKAELAGII